LRALKGITGVALYPGIRTSKGKWDRKAGLAYLDI